MPSLYNISFHIPKGKPGLAELVILLTLLFFSSPTFAGTPKREVTKFLGIPVDGSRSAMEKKLSQKGFNYNPNSEYFEGEFNGEKVNVGIVTNKEKVWRIFIADAIYRDERAIKARFNNLCRQFDRKKQEYSYASSEDKNPFIIPDDQDLEYEIGAKRKRYEATYYQITTPIDTASLINFHIDYMSKRYTEEQICDFMNRPTDSIMYDLMLEVSEYFGKRKVWFMIDREGYDRYRILMYYDNGYNKANGEDL